MANRADSDIDDDLRDLYKEYTGPLGSAPTNANTQDKEKPNKRSHAGSDEEEEEPRDPNAVPTDFTSREAKVWEAKSKATERNWKKRKEEEMICKICGESGHFTQGCPSTLGANRKSQDFFERIPARDKNVRALFTEKVLSKIERDIGCKIKMDEKFIIVSGKDRLVLAKGVDAVHKIREEGEQRGPSSSHMPSSRSPERSHAGARFQRSEPQRSHSGPRNASQFQPRFGRQERIVEDRMREDVQKFARSSPQAYGNSGARGRSSHSRSPRQPPYAGNSYNSIDGRNQNMGSYRNDGWDSHRRESAGMQPSHQFDYSTSPKTLEELELQYKKEANELMKNRDREEDEENFKHREAVRDLRENYMNKVAMLRASHAKQWEEFLQLDAQRCQQQAIPQIPSGYGGYKQQNFTEYDGSTVNPHYAGSNLPLESRNRFSDMEAYPNRPHDNFGEFQRRGGDFAKAYNRY